MDIVMQGTYTFQYVGLLHVSVTIKKIKTHTRICIFTHSSTTKVPKIILLRYSQQFRFCSNTQKLSLPEELN